MKSRESRTILCAMCVSLLLAASPAPALLWIPQKAPTMERLTGVDFLGADRGWAVGSHNTLICTTDGGRCWQDCGGGLPKMRLDLTDVDFVNERAGWITGSTRPCDEEACAPVGIVLATTDGGRSWDVVFRGDGGTDPEEPSLRIGPLEGLFFLDELHGWVVGADGVVLRTRDGGEVWTIGRVGGSAIPEVHVDLKDVDFVDLERGWVVGHRVDMNRPEHLPVIFRSEDGGETWTEDYNGAGDRGGLNGLDMLAPLLESPASTPAGWAVGEGGLILGYAEGRWERQSFPWPLSLPLPEFHAVRGVDGATGWIAGGRPCTECMSVLPMFRPVILSTGDAGNTWNLEPVPGLGRLFGLSFPEPGAGWAVGSRGTILHACSGCEGRVQIGRVWAEPNPVFQGERIELCARVGIIGPLAGESGNEVESVQANITELLGVDCREADCILWREMTDEDGDGVYTCAVEEVTGPPARVPVPIVAEDRLGHTDEALLQVEIRSKDDVDGDGVPDADDDCTLVPDPDQRDTDGDGFGNVCDPDLDQDGITFWPDLVSMIRCLGPASTDTGPACEDADLDGDGRVGLRDLMILIRYWRRPPGPSGLVDVVDGMDREGG